MSPCCSLNLLCLCCAVLVSGVCVFIVFNIDLSIFFLFLPHDVFSTSLPLFTARCLSLAPFRLLAIYQPCYERTLCRAMSVQLVFSSASRRDHIVERNGKSWLLDKRGRERLTSVFLNQGAGFITDVQRTSPTSPPVALGQFCAEGSYRDPQSPLCSRCLPGYNSWSHLCIECDGPDANAILEVFCLLHE